MFRDTLNLSKVFPPVKWLLCHLRAGVLISDFQIWFFPPWKSKHWRCSIEIKYIKNLPFPDWSVLLFDTLCSLIVPREWVVQSQAWEMEHTESVSRVSPAPQWPRFTCRVGARSRGSALLGWRFRDLEEYTEGGEHPARVGMESRQYKAMTSHLLKWWMRGE